MRFNIPVTALVALLVNTAGTAARKNKNQLPKALHDDIHSDPSNSFTCNEPFMIPAEYIDSTGNSFAMCLSDPRFSKKQIIWYIQEMAGSYKALGVAKRSGNNDFVGTVIPIEQPDAGSGMHADPVAVKLTLDKASGVVIVKPQNKSGQLVNWIIRPNGFPLGSLKVPDSCGPFLKPLEKAELLAPLTGAASGANVCIAHGAHADAFISWGNFKTDQEIDPLSIDGGVEPNFFSVGFVGADRGVSIDLCDHGNDQANRCELSRLVGHIRKTFVVGSGAAGNVADDRVKEHKAKEHKAKEHKVKKHAKKEVISDQAFGSCDLPSNPEPVKHHKKRQHKRHHEDRSNALIAKIDMIERDIRSILERAEARQHKAKHHHARKEVASDIDEALDAPACPMVKKHKTKKCDVQHPLLYPPEPAGTIAPAVVHERPRPDNSRIQEANMNARFNRLQQRLSRMEAQVRQSEFNIRRRLAAFNNWMQQQRQAMQKRAADFANYLQQLKSQVVYTPKSSKRKFISGLGRTLRGSKNAINNGLFDDSDNDVASTTNSFFSGIRNAATSFKADIIDPTVTGVENAGSYAVNKVGNAGSYAVNKVGNAGNYAVNSIDNAGNYVVNTVENVFDPATVPVNNIPNPVPNPALVDPYGDAPNIGNTVVQTVRPVYNAANTVVDNVNPVIVDAYGNIKSAANTVSNTVNPVIVDAYGNVISAANSAVNTVNPVIVDAYGNINNAANTVANNANPVVVDAGNTLNNYVVDPVSGAATFVAAGTVSAANQLADGTVSTAKTAETFFKKDIAAPVSKEAKSASRYVKNMFSGSVKPKTGRKPARFDINDDLMPPARASLAKGPGLAVAAANPLGPVGPVMPPPASKEFGVNTKPDPIRAAIDYLS